MTAFDYQQWRTASAVTPEMLDSCLDRITALEAENERLKKDRDQWAGTCAVAANRIRELESENRSMDDDLRLLRATDSAKFAVAMHERAEQAEAELATAKAFMCGDCRSAWDARAEAEKEEKP